MRITLLRFRTHSGPVTFDFPGPGLNLLAGESGAGKTTVLRALYWALYGSMQHISSMGTTATAAEPVAVIVELPEMGNLAIRRTKPGTLEVGTSTGTLSGEAAQAYVETTFGSKELWLATSYIQQGKLCPLMTLPAAERFDLLHELTFGNARNEDTPTSRVEKVEAQLGGIRAHLASQNAAYSAHLQIYTAETTNSAALIAAWQSRPSQYAGLPVERMHELQAQNAVELSRLERALQSTSIREAEQRTYLEQATALEAKLAGLTPPSADQLTTLQSRQQLLQTQLTEWRAQEHTRSGISRLTAQLATFPSSSTSYSSVEAAREVRSQVQNQQDLHAQLSTLGVTAVTLPVVLQELQARLERNSKVERTYQEWKEEQTNREKIAQQKWEAECRAHALECAQLREVHTAAVARRDAALAVNRQIEQAYQLKLARYQHETMLFQQAQEKAASYAAQLFLHQAALAAEREEEEFHQRRLEVWGTLQHTALTAESLNQFISKCRLSFEELLCPHCSRSVRYHGGKLEPGLLHEADRPELQRQLDAALDIQSAMKGRDRILAAGHAARAFLAEPAPTVPIFSLTSPVKGNLEEIPPLPTLSLSPEPTLVIPNSVSIPPSPLLPSEVGQLQERCRQLSTVTLPSLSAEQIGMELEAISNYLSRLMVEEELTRLQQHLPTVQTDPTIEYHQVSASLSVGLQQQQQATYLSAELAEMRAKIIPSPPPSSAELTEQISAARRRALDLQKLVQAGTLVEKLEGTRAALEAQRTSLLAYAKYEGQLLELKALINEVATAAMEEVVTAINLTANAILEHLFDGDTKILLATHRTLKTKEVTKLQVNLQVSHNGKIYDSPSHLSGGEESRISLALTLALAKINGSPVLLLDECLASLSALQREKCLKAIRYQLGHKTVIHICHEIVEGHHDSVVRV